MSWLSEFLHSPIDYISENPLKALSLLAAPAAAIAAPFAFPALGGALGIGAGAGAGAAAGSGAVGAGLLGAEAPFLLGGGAGLGAEGAAAGGLGGLGLFGGGGAEGGSFLGGLEGLFGGGGAEGGFGSALGFAPEGATGGFGSGVEGLGALKGGADATAGAFSAGVPDWANSVMMDTDWIARMFPGEFGPSSATFGDVMSAAPTAGDVGGGVGGGLGGIVTDPGMAGAPLAGTADAVATGTSGPLTAAQPGFMDNLVTGATNSLTKNPLGIGLAGLGLGYNILQGQQTSPEMKALGANAAALNAQGQQLMSYLQNGTLPPGLQTAVDNATHAMKARIIANHAKNGQSTNPAQNSALAQELNQVDLNAVALIAQQGQQLLTTGMNATNMSTQLYGMLENLNRQSSQRTGQAIANFAAALSGGPRGVNINLGGARA